MWMRRVSMVQVEKKAMNPMASRMVASPRNRPTKRMTTRSGRVMRPVRVSMPSDFSLCAEVADSLGRGEGEDEAGT